MPFENFVIFFEEWRIDIKKSDECLSYSNNYHTYALLQIASLIIAMRIYMDIHFVVALTLQITTSIHNAEL